MSNVLAGVARGQLEYLDEHKIGKKKIYERYKEGLKDIPVTMNPYLKESDPNFWLSCITINEDAYKEGIDPGKIRKVLAKYNVESRPIWKPMHMQPIYESRDYVTLPGENIGTDIFERGICLPSDLNMTAEEQDIVIDIIKECFE